MRARTIQSLRPAAALMFIAAAIGLAPVPAATAAEPTEPIRFRRIYVPADAPQAWPLGEARYLPIDREEFLRLLRLADADGRGAPHEGPRLIDVELTARLEGEALVDGTARLRIEQKGDAPGLLSLAPLSPAIARATWDDGRSALLGRSATEGAAVVVEQGGELLLEWSQRAVREPGGQLRFELELPAAARRRMRLTLPAATLPRLADGIVTPAGRNGATQDWQIELGGHAKSELRIAPSGEADRRTAVVRQRSTYDFTPRGMELSAQLQLDAHDLPLDRLEIDLDPGLQLVAARLDQQELPWTVSQADAEGRTGAVVELPDRLAGSKREVRLVAVAPLVTDRLWRLPTMRVQGLFWTEGKAELLLPEPLALAQLELAGCRQTRGTLLAPPRRGRLLELQLFSPEAVIEVRLDRQPPQVEVRQGTTVTISRGELAANVALELLARAGERFELVADVTSAWTVDRVQSDPPGRVADWSLAPAGGESRRLEVRLASALDAERPLRLLLRARTGNSAVAEALPWRDFRPLTLRDTEVAASLVLLRADPPLQLDLRGDRAAVRLDPGDLALAEAVLLDDPFRGIVIRDDEAADALRVRARPQQPRFGAAVDVRATFADDALQQQFAFTCLPEGPPVERLLVHFSTASPTPPVWTSEEGTLLQPPPRRLSTADQATAGLGSAGESWEVSFRPPRSGPIRFSAIRTSPLSAELPLGLAALPEAVSHEALLRIGDGADRVQIDNRRLEAVAPPATPPGQSPRDVATFRYEPLRDVLAGREPAVTLTPVEPDPRRRGAWVWLARLDSRYAAGGTVSHVASYQVESVGERVLQMQLPAGALLRSVWVDGQQLAAADSAGQLTVDLPADRKFPVVDIQFETGAAPLGFVRNVRPEWPQLRLPVLAQRWTLWLPPGYASDAGVSGLPWTERLFGPLGRSDREAPFDPTRLDDWRGLLAVTTRQQVARSDGANWLAWLGAVVVTRRATGLTWGELVRSADDAPNSDGLVDGSLIDSRLVEGGDGADASGGGASEQLPTAPPLLVDPWSLAEAGVLPHYSLLLPPLGDPRAQAAALLEQAGLAVLVHPRCVVLTTSATAARFRMQLAPLDLQSGGGGETAAPLWQVQPGMLFASLAADARLPGEPPLVDAARWAEEPQFAPHPWARARRAPSGVRGWSASSVSPAATGNVRVVRRSSMQALAWCTLLVAWAAGSWLLTSRPQLRVALLAASAALALLLPIPYVAIAAGVFLGIVCSRLTELLKQLSTPPVEAPPLEQVPPESRLKLAGETLAPLLFVAVMLLASPALAQERPASPPRLHQVLIPVDAERNPTDKVHLPEALFHALSRRAAAASPEVRGWLISAARYRGELAPQGAAGGPPLRGLTAFYRLHVFSQPARVVLPLRPDEVELRPEGPRLDGRPLAATWEPEGLQLIVRQPGAYELSLPLALRGRPDPTAPQVAFQIPAVPESQLELSVAGDPERVRVPTARGGVTFDPRRNLVQAALGGCDRLQVAWPAEDAAAESVTAEQLLWIKIAPGAVLLDARIKLDVAEEQVVRLRLATDPRLRLLPFPPDSAVAAVVTEPGTTPTHVLTLKPAGDEQTIVDARLLLTGASGVGRLRPPQWQLAGVRTTARLLAVSIDSALEFDERVGEDVRSLAIPDFVARWGDDAPQPQPQLAYELLETETGWSIATRSRRVSTSADEAIHLNVGGGGVEVRYEARVEMAAGSLFQHRLEVPAGLRIRDVSLGERSLDWSRDGSQLHVFLPEPVSTTHTLTLQGELPLPAGNRFRLPRVQLQTTAPGGRQLLHVYRRPDLLLSLFRTRDLEPRTVSAPTPLGEGWGRRVATLQVSGPRPLGLLDVRANRPRVAATLVTTLERGDDAWQAELHCRLDVKAPRGDAPRNVVDDLLLELPAWWEGPFEVAPGEVELRQQQIPGSDRLRLRLRPANAIDGSWEVRLRGKLPAGVREAVRVPDVVPVGLDNRRRFLVLPTQSELQQIAWQVRGLQASPLPEGFAPPLPAPGAFETYEIVGPRFSAVPRPLDATARQPRVVLADVQVDYLAAGGLRGVASFDLEPAGLRRCRLLLPPGGELIAASVDRLPAQLDALDDGWNLTLGPPRLPQRIELLYRVAPGDGAERSRIAAPRLARGDEPLPVGTTLWTVRPARGTRLSLRGAGSVTSSLQRRLRLDSIVRVLEGEAGLSHSATELARWYRPWARRVQLAESAAVAAEREAESPTAHRAALQRTMERHADATERLGTTSLWNDLVDAPAPATDAIDVWRAALDAAGPALYAATSGNESLPVDVEPASDEGGPWRPLAALALAILAVAASLRRLPVAMLDVLPRWPRAVGVVVGLFWWLWMWPSAVGLLILVASLLAGRHLGWMAAPPPARDSDSTIVRVPTGEELW